MSQALVEVKDLKKYFSVTKTFVEEVFSRKKEHVRAVDEINFNISKGDVFGLAGESGSGKTTTGRLLLRLIEPTEGEILFNGVNIQTLKGDELKRFRRHVQVIFQDPYASLNPRMKVGDAIGHPLEIHGLAAREEKRERVLRVLEKVGLTPPETFYESYPHQLSGGQRQRVAIARAIVLEPRFIVADEPVSMLDVSIRTLLLNLMLNLKRDLDLTYLFITHDLAVSKYICNRIAIMYLGKIVEIGLLEKVFSKPLHPYTVALLSAVPVPDPKAKRARIIPAGEIPDPINPPLGCRFHPRCSYAKNLCSKKEPPFIGEPGHQAACHYADELDFTMFKA